MTSTQSPTKASQATAELPKLPEPTFTLLDGWNNSIVVYTADQMNAHGLARYEAGRASSVPSGWISVEDRVPEVISDENTPVWSWDGHQVREDNYCTEWDQPAGPMVGGWARIGENFDSSRHGTTVTHWMARTIPNPPSLPATPEETK